MKSVFATYHPVINFGFFCGVIGIGIFVLHPVFLSVAVLAALTFALILGGRGTLKFVLCFLLPMTLLTTVVNPLINHMGNTVLFYTEYNQITLEAAIYGMVTGLMLSSTLLWFSSYNRIMTGDKFSYLFGKAIPALSLIFLMVMRFVPNFKYQIIKISDAQKCIGRDVTNGTKMKKARHGIKIISIMLTWVLENAIDTADSMRSRGYGLRDRSSFSIYRFDRRDGVAGIFLLCMTGIVLVGAIMGKCSIIFYPNIVMADFNGFGLVVCLAYFCLCFFPVTVEVREVVVWRHIQSKI